MRYLPLLALIVAVSPAYGLPGASEGASCEEFFAAEVAGGGEIMRRYDMGEGQFSVTLKSRFEDRETMGLFVCSQGKISDQTLVVMFPTEKTAIHWFHLFRDELSRKYGKPYFDGTNPEELQRYEQFFDLLDSEIKADDFRHYVLWATLDGSRSVGVGTSSTGWLVTLSFNFAGRPTSR